MPSTIGIVASSQNFPLSLNPALWFDAADTTTITESSGSVSQWNDKSGNGKNVVQANGAAQPTTGTTTQNGLNVISFDGTDDFLESANGAASFDTVECYFIGLTSVDSRVLIGVPHAATHTSPFHRWLLFHNTINRLSIRVNSVLSSSANNVVSTSNAAIYRLETGTGDGYINTTRVINASGATNTYPNSTPLQIGTIAGGGAYLNGFVAEVLIFDRALNEDEKTTLNNYLTSKWNI
jgi:hypothetical protein